MTFFESVFDYLTSDELLGGAWIAIQLVAAAFVGGVVLGFPLALMRESKLRVFRAVSGFYVWIVRGVPLLLILVFLYNILPQWGLVLDPIPTAILGFSLHEGAYVSEIVRGGIHSVAHNQVLAADSLGMSRFAVLRKVVLPQALRAMVPAYGNQTIILLKTTSLASVIAVPDLMQRTSSLASQNFEYFEVFTASALIYLALTTVVAVVQSSMEQGASLATDKRGWIVETFVRVKRAIAHGPLHADPAAAEPADTPATEKADASSAPPGDLVSTASAALLEADTMRPIGRRGRRRALPPNGSSAAATVPTSGEAFLVCDDVHKSYHGVPVLKGVSLSVDPGEVVVVMGPSGSGKSTLLRLVMHLETLDGGEITLDGRHIGYDRVDGVLHETRQVSRARADAGIAMVFQQFNLFEHLTALDNVTVALRHVYKIPQELAEQRGLEMLAAVGLRSHADHRPRKLSGGQQQRVAIARALATRPRLMLLDEPTSALDPELIGEVRAVIRGLAEAGMTMVVVTHDVAFARESADRIVVLQNGVIADEGPPETILRDPERAETQQYSPLLEG